MAEVSVHAQDTDVSQAKLGNYFQNSKNDLTYLRNRTCYIDDALSISERTCAPLFNEHLDEAVTRVRRYFIRISASLIPEVERGRIPQVVLPDCLQSFVHN